MIHILTWPNLRVLKATVHREERERAPASTDLLPNKIKDLNLTIPRMLAYLVPTIVKSSELLENVSLKITGCDRVPFDWAGGLLCALDKHCNSVQT
jgi:hypothetical protein